MTFDNKILIMSAISSFMVIGLFGIVYAEPSIIYLSPENSPPAQVYPPTECTWGTTWFGSCITAGDYLNWCIGNQDQRGVTDEMKLCMGMMTGELNQKEQSKYKITITNDSVILYPFSCPNYIMINKSGSIQCDNQINFGFLPWSLPN